MSMRGSTFPVSGGLWRPLSALAGQWLRPPLLCALAVFFLVSCGPGTPDKTATLQQAQAWMDAGEFENAIALLTGLEGHYPGDFEVRETLALAYGGQGDAYQAALTFIEIADSDPQQGIYRLFAAQALKDAGDLVGASTQYETYLDTNPDDAATWRSLGNVREEQGLTSQAIAALLRANRLQPSGALQNQIGRLYLRAGNLAQAQSWYASASRHQDDARPAALLGLLETALRAEQWAAAEDIVLALDEAYPGTLEASPLASVREDLERWRTQQAAALAAAEALRTAEEAPAPEPEPAVEPQPQPEPAPGAPAPQPREAEATAGTPSPETEVPEPPAQAAAPRAAEEPAPESPAPAATPFPQPDAPLPYRLAVSAGQRAADNAQWAEAVAQFRRALAVDDRDARLWRVLSEAYLAQGTLDWAQATAREAQRREPGRVTHVLHLLAIVEQRSAPRVYFEEVRRWQRQFPRDPDLTLRLARAFGSVEGDRRSERRLLAEFLRLAPEGHPDAAAVEAELARPPRN